MNIVCGTVRGMHLTAAKRPIHLETCRPGDVSCNRSSLTSGSRNSASRRLSPISNPFNARTTNEGSACRDRRFSGATHGQNRAVCGPNYRMGIRAENDSVEGVPPLDAHDDHVGRTGRGRLEYLPRWHSFSDKSLHRTIRAHVSRKQLLERLKGAFSSVLPTVPPARPRRREA